VVACLTGAEWHVSDSARIPFICALFPGDSVMILLTGGHGGSIAGDAIAAVIGFIINFVVYLTLFWPLFGWYSAKHGRGSARL
jgi:hypothetical protein